MEWRLPTRLQWQFAALILCAAFLAGCGGGGGSGGSTPAPVVSAPTITAQPQSQAVTTGSAATFSVTASGAATLSYQWSRNGSPITGATSATYTVSASTLSDSGASFTVVVSNLGGQVTSAAAVLTANADPEGLYIGTLSNSLAGTTLPVFAIVLKDGSFAIFASTGNFAPKTPLGMAITGRKISTTVGSFTASYTATTQPGLSIGGQTSVSGTMTGTIVPGTSITGSYVSSLDSGSFTVNTMADYGRAASLATIAGTYQYSYVANVFIDATTTIAADGSATVSDTVPCSGPATYAVPDAAHNAYKVTNSAQCAGQPSMPMFDGLGAFFPAGTGAALNGGVNFSTDTFVAIAANGTNGFMIISSK